MLSTAESMALLGVPMMSMWAKEEANAIASLTMTGDVPEIVANDLLMLYC